MFGTTFLDQGPMRLLEQGILPSYAPSSLARKNASQASTAKGHLLQSGGMRTSTLREPQDLLTLRE